VAISTSQDVDYLHTADAPSPALAQQHATIITLLPDRLKNSTLTIEQFRRLLKSFLFFQLLAHGAH